MIWYFTPFALDKKFLATIDSYFDLVTNQNDWVVLMDGDTAFLRPDWGNVIADYISKYPNTGMFTCFASRCHYGCQVPAFGDVESDSILFHKRISDRVHNENAGNCIEVKRRIAGHLMCIKKSTWSSIRDDVYKQAADKLILGVDTKISNVLIQKGLPIRIMTGLYVFHYLRLAEGFDSDIHLK